MSLITNGTHPLITALQVLRITGEVITTTYSFVATTHAFGVSVQGERILNADDLSTLSFHATKVYNTIEGEKMVIKEDNLKARYD